MAGRACASVDHSRLPLGELSGRASGSLQAGLRAQMLDWMLR